MTEIVVSLFVLLGALFMILGSLSIIRMPDSYTRINAATKASTLGVIGIMLGVFLYFLYIEDIMSGKILLTIVFVFITAPVGGFMMARSAFNDDVPFAEENSYNDLQKHVKKKKVNENG